MLISDSRESFREYAKPVPYFHSAPQALLEGMAKVPGMEVHVLSCLQQPVSSPEKLAPNIWYHGLHVPKIGWMRTGYQGCIRAVRKHLKTVRPDIVHGQGTERDCGLSAIFSGCPNILTVHGNIRLIARVIKVKPFSFNWFAARLESFTLPRTDGVVCITRYTQEAVAASVRRTWLVHNAVDSSFFEVRPNPDPLATILCVGAVGFRKNQNRFILALDSLAARQKFQVIFLGEAGADPYGAEFFELLKTRPWCVYGGYADRGQLKGYFSKATMLALPSLEDNCPMAVLEAMAAGVPVLAANVGGVPDLIDHQRTGLFCNPEDPSSMSEGVEAILNQPATRSEMAAAARKEALERFHPTAIAVVHQKIYQEVLNKH